MNNILILANAVSLVGCVMMVITGFLREKRQILTVQCFQFGFLSAANLLLGAMSGFFAGVVSIARNLVFSRVKSSLPLKLVFVAVQILLSAGALGKGWLEWLPLLASLVFTWIIDTRDERLLKSGLIAAQSLWFVYDLCYRNYVTMVFDVLTILTNLAGIVMLCQKKPE